MPKQTITALDSLQLLIEQKENDVFLIEAEAVSVEDNNDDIAEETEDIDEQREER